MTLRPLRALDRGLHTPPKIPNLSFLTYAASAVERTVMLPHLSFMLLSQNHRAELERHTRDARGYARRAPAQTRVARLFRPRLSRHA